MHLDSTAFVADRELLEVLRPHATPINCDQDRPLFDQGDTPTGLFLVLAGSVTITMDSPQGDEVMSFDARPGSLLGLPAVIGNCAYSLSAWAKGGAEIAFVSRERFSALMLSDPRLSMMILRVLANEVRTARLAITKG
ncbi:Crp/Fnr family transcriptional regulator [Acidobacteria bacterium AB60]|nr:Crp/Fnr family transcriptional regulator [Acidobacteria bacterium AB60]